MPLYKNEKKYNNFCKMSFFILTSETKSIKALRWYYNWNWYICPLVYTSMLSSFFHFIKTTLVTCRYELAQNETTITIDIIILFIHYKNVTFYFKAINSCSYFSLINFQRDFSYIFLIRQTLLIFTLFLFDLWIRKTWGPKILKSARWQERR